MVPPKDGNATHVENPEHEALLTGAIALASLFSSCVEAFGLIHPSQKWDKQEQLLLTRLGLQQARLLIWGSVLGISSPPPTVTNRAVPKHPSSAYPDLSEPTFFDARDPRLDEPQFRTAIEETLSSIVDRASHLTREEMMAKYGLKPPKRFTMVFEPALDTNRLEFFRERYELLREVAESYAHINTRRTNSIVQTSWSIADVTKFGAWIQITQDKIDYLISLLDVKEKVDRGMRMDIRMFGWHIAPDRARTAQDVSKLRLLQEVCRVDYPEYVVATQQALDNISRESRENNLSMAPTAQQQALFGPPQQSNGGAAAQGHADKKRPGLFKIFRSFGKSKHHPPSRAKEDPGPLRSQSESGPTADPDEDESLQRVRSKSVGGYVNTGGIDEDIATRLEKFSTHEQVMEMPRVDTSGGGQKEGERLDSPLVLEEPKPLPLGVVQRHDQYRGIARVETRDLRQPGADFGSG
ncbi:hypothetical protein M409DRAFT_58949 [Zasmidium cellare ATCC 36951]|uniref:Prion-inhibition and propagation HeLo domain-containing protein n=1 Tax=Zasmidium cellare ATCC 36951 TaxID=1080233 RepID=A0A6A6C3B8_ZASCE|nr:uncharacterized protein M409DRAFT_58949 [Zasmidium cellare ATCC 36951]KAF2161551.1 hypothetical protein M409DRAFT_58949 [Zasmidium cellare ATCC 36951]